MGKSRSRISFDRNWNEFNTFSKVIYPYLEKKLGYPSRDSKFFDEQTWVRKQDDRQGPYDGAFRDENGSLILLIEAKREEKVLDEADVQQAFDYCFGSTFIIPPPYVLVSNGTEHRWFRRIRQSEDHDYVYTQTEAIGWKKAKEQSGAGAFVEQLSLKSLIKALSLTRSMLFNDLANSYFPRSFKLSESSLGIKRRAFEQVLDTRKSFVDSSLADLEEAEAVRNVLSSIALSLTLKILFVKILTERANDPFPSNIRATVRERATYFPGILVAEPYDVLEFSDEAESKLVNMFQPIGVLEALLFQASDNAIGDVWDGLIQTELQDLQVKSLGNVYTPDPIVKSMTNASERALGSWIDRKVLEPSCGSGHFVREVYSRIRNAYLKERPGITPNPVLAHERALNNIRAIDIDPFAVQTTQLGMFLELYRSKDVWKALAPNDRFDFSAVVDRADFLDDGLLQKFADFRPDLIIGNPPYGVKVTSQTMNRFQLGSDDSYGCFVARSLDLLKPDGQLVFVVSNTFMTTKTHRPLREIIFRKSEIQDVLQLHRSAFAGRDVFCCLLRLKKKASELPTDYFYRYCDAWPIHPEKPEYNAALENWSTNKAIPLPQEIYFEYFTKAPLARFRRIPPHAKEVERFLDNKEFIGQRPLALAQERALPIHGGSTSLFPLVLDEACSPYTEQVTAKFPGLGDIDALAVNRNGGCKVTVIKLWQVARVIQGMATADDQTFIRKSPNVIPNARRRNILDVNPALTLQGSALLNLTEEEKQNGIEVLDLARTKYFVPFDKGGEQDTGAGDLRAYWSPVDYWIDWSKESVSELKRRSEYKAGIPKKAVIRNPQYYFRQGIRFSPAGLYAPMFEQSFGAVPGHKGSIILPCDEAITPYLLAILCSPVTRYLTKNFLQHTVMTEIDIIKQIAIPVPNQKIFEELTALSNEIISTKEKYQDTKLIVEKVNDAVLELFALDESDEQELALWIRRRYPNLGRSKRPEMPTPAPSPTKI